MGEPPGSPVNESGCSVPLSESLSSFSLSAPSSPSPLVLQPISQPQLEPIPLPQRERNSYSKFELLPPELIEQITHHLIFETCQTGPPNGLLNLVLVSKRFERVLNFNKNSGFYAQVFKQRFDSKGVERRWEIMRNISEKREKLLLLETLPESKASEEIFLNPESSFTRPSSPTRSNCSPWDPLTSRDYALELVRRCQVLTRMRLAVINEGQPWNSLLSSRPSSPRMMSFTPRNGTTKLSEPDELTMNLWTCYLMLLENDEKNLKHLLEYAKLREYMKLFYKHSLLAEALNPGWPRQTAGRALGLWIGWLGGDDLNSETSRESEERFFVLKPYVFAAHKFDAFIAPWTIPRLPVTHEEFPTLPPPAGPYLADLRPRSQAQTITHMNRKIDLSPPNLSHAAIFSFFHRVEQDPSVQDDLLVQGTNTPAQSQQPQTVNSNLLGGLTANSRPTKTCLPILSSKIHDKDFIRLASCIDPFTSKGLPSLYTRGDLSGNWEGRFSFFDFDSYRDMLGGRMRSLYEGPFGDQPQVWKLEEKVVKLEPPCNGPVLNAGFQLGTTGISGASGRPTQGTSRSMSYNATSSQSPPPVTRRRRTASFGGIGTEPSSSSSSSIILEEFDQDDFSTSNSTTGEAGGGGVDERFSKKRKSNQKRFLLGGGGGGEAFWEDDELDEFGRRKGQELEDGDYEILLTGSGHSAWGQFNLKGRVRSWDGMFTIIKEYTPDSRGRWIYRGYRIGDSLVGRWRDTHTPVDMSGYEGTWSMNRRK
ncbi:hypothetical protein JCM3765_001467 [Sporobolomyces pararoseus]